MEKWNYTLHITEDKQVNLNKLIFNGSAKLFEFPKRTCVPPAHSYPVANVTQCYRNVSNPKKSACRKKKKIKSTQKGNRNQKNLSKITHTDKNKTSINRTYCIMPFSWLEEKFKRFRFSSASSCREPEPRILNSMGGCVSATTQPRPCLPYKAQDKINPHIQKELATPLSLGNKL